MMKQHILCIIPARFGARRLPGKPLQLIEGQPLIVWVYRNAVASGAFDEVCVAADDERIIAAVREAGGSAEMTAETHQSGTDRINEVAGRLSCTHIVNIQGDEPCIDHDNLKAFSTAIRQIDDNSLLTLVGHATIEEKLSPNVVKAVLDRHNRALYFTRAAVPFERDGTTGPCLKHMGIYGFTAKSLQRFCSFPVGILERTERLEQLRALENGMTIQCIVRDFSSNGIDTMEDLELFRQKAPECHYGT